MLVGLAKDKEDGLLLGELVWTMDSGVILGQGAFIKPVLPVGEHIINLKATDSGGLTSICSVMVMVKPKVPQSGPPPSVQPSIEITYLPGYGSLKNLTGRVLGVKPADYRVAVYLKQGGWYNKPNWKKPKVTIAGKGSFTCDVTTGPNDLKATAFALYVVSKDYNPPLAQGGLVIDPSIEANAVAKLVVKRVLDASDTRPPWEPKKLKAICFGPFRDNENPDEGIFPKKDELIADCNFIPNIASAIRTYGCTNTPALIPGLCDSLNIDCWPGAWLGEYKTDNAQEVQSLIDIANHGYSRVKALIVGNEVLLREDMAENELIDYIRRVKGETELPVTSAETWSVLLDHPDLVNELDFILVHIHPYWDGVACERAAQHVFDRVNELKVTYPEKHIVIGETGWPCAGDITGGAVPSPLNQARFAKEFLQMAEKENIDYFFFEAFDEKWKAQSADAASGPHWGLFNSDGSIKEHIKGILPPDAEQTISRPARIVMPVEVAAPLVVYRDAGAVDNSFYPSGWMGDSNYISFDDAWVDNPHSGNSCIRLSFPSFAPDFVPPYYHPWGGIYWQYPLNNWGKYPGYNLTGASKLSFWVRADYETTATFAVGGLNSNLAHKDSFGPLSVVVDVTQNWCKKEIDLAEVDTSSVIGGFMWSTSMGQILYLDDIEFEAEAPKDVTVPVVNIWPPSDSYTYYGSTAYYVRESSLDLKGTAFDNVELKLIEWINDRGGSGTCLGTTSWNVKGMNLAPGSNIITVTATDASGNRGSDTITVNYTTPEIEVLGNTQSITSGNTVSSIDDGTDFGSIHQYDGIITHDFIVTNTGDAPLVLGELIVPDGYTIIDPLKDTIYPGYSDSFAVALSSKVMGAFSGTISFANNDLDENPFSFQISGEVTEPLPTSLLFTSVPMLNTFDRLYGKAVGVNPDEFAIAIYIKVGLWWWTKPTWANPITSINQDGTWVCNITTGGVDQMANEIIGFLIPKSYAPPSLGGNGEIPQELYDNSVAYTSVKR